jgi:hypothetical protein
MERNVQFVYGIGKFISKQQCMTASIVFLLFDSRSSFCLGCSFESNDEEFRLTGGTIAIEWESSAYYLRYLSNREQVCIKHEYEQKHILVLTSGHVQCVLLSCSYLGC